jgi:hypothetical protein
MYKIAVNGIVRDMTAEEVSAYELDQQTNRFQMAMETLRGTRNSLLSETDWVVLPDSPIADKTAWETYRTQLRDITNGLTTVEQVEAVVFPTKPN